MHYMSIDLETFSSEPIKKTGLYKYAQSSDFAILLFAYSLDGAPVKVIDLTEPDSYIPAEVVDHLFDRGTVKRAFNAAFEWYCLSRYFGLNDEDTQAWLSEWEDTELEALYYGYPASLEMAGKAVGLPEDKQKASIGKALIKYFCAPCKPTKVNGGRTRNLPRHAPDKWELFKEYNAQDVEAEMAISERLPELPEMIKRQWRLDQKINLRGVAADLDLMDSALWCMTTEQEALKEEAVRLTGLSNPNSVSQLIKWLEEETGEEHADLRKDTVKDILAGDLDSDKARRVLEIRQLLGKTSVKKYNALETCVCADGRVRGLLMFYGANRTGREAGRLVQVQNLPHDTVPCEDVARELVKARNLEGIKAVYGSVPHTLSALIRTAFIASDGTRFVDADFSAIEARVIAWLAREEWVLDVFRTHGKIYEATASQMFNIPIEKIKKGNPEYAYRAKGKVATLALGYQGGPGALVAMGALRSGIPEEDLPDIVKRWRESNPNIVRFWYDVQTAAENAILYGMTSKVNCVEIGTFGQALAIKLPSGRSLFYNDAHFGKNRFGDRSIVYMGMNQTTKQWTRVETYGGKLVENITQAVARDCLFYAIENLEAAGYPIVFDIHDEVVCEVPEANASLEKVVEIMAKPPEWASDLPLNADGWVGSYFHKD